MKKNPDSVLKRRLSEPEMAALIRETHPLGAKISDKGKRLTLDDGSVWVWDSRFEHWALWSLPRKKNPRTRPKITKDFDKAYSLYKEFREEIPKRGRKVEFEMPKALMIMGNIRAISYDTTRRRKTELYKHDFAAGSRPLLCADGRTGKLFIIEGRYHVTPRGIVDIDARGKELE